MNRTMLNLATALAWLALPLTGLNYWRSWDRLPARMAIHFDADWQPNGWTTRSGALGLALGTTAFLLVVFTIAFYAMRKANVPSSPAWMVLTIFYLALGFVCFINNWVVERNLSANSSLSMVHARRFSNVEVFLGMQVRL